MNMMTDFTWRIVVTVLTAAVSFLVWQMMAFWWHRRLNRWLRKQARMYEEKHGVREAALVLSVMTDAAESARGHLRQSDRGDIPVLRVYQAEAFGDDPGQWQGFLERVKREIRTVRELGFTRLYVYAGTPVALALMVGATLTNGPEAVVHHYANGVYREVGRVSFETTRL